MHIYTHLYSIFHYAHPRSPPSRHDRRSALGSSPGAAWAALRLAPRQWAASQQAHRAPGTAGGGGVAQGTVR